MEELPPLKTALSLPQSPVTLILKKVLSSIHTDSGYSFNYSSGFFLSLVLQGFFLWWCSQKYNP